jgi:hypothetical protein
MPASPDGAPRVAITAARVEMADGTVVALVESVTIGGGVQVVTVDGVPEERQHPTLHRFHCRLLSPDRMIPDQLFDVETYDEAVDVGLAYAARRAEHAQQLVDLAASLRI